MGALANAVGGLGKTLLLGLLLLVCLGYLSTDQTAGRSGAGNFSCSGFTNDPDFNRMICRFHPKRLWNTPVTEVFPFLAPTKDQESVAG